MTKITIYTILTVLIISGCREQTNVDLLSAKKSELESEIILLKEELKETIAALEKANPKNIEIRYPAVSVIESEQGMFEHFIEVQGAIDTDDNVIVTPEQGGKIVSLPVKKGQYIRRGATIAMFDTEILASNRSQLEEQLSTAKYMYDKQKTLFDKGVSTEIALKQAEGQYKSLLKSIDVLNTQQSKSVLVAPFSGYVEDVFSVVGGMANPSTPIVKLISLNTLKVVANVSENYLNSLSKSSKVDIFFPALNHHIRNLSISRIGKSVNPVNRTILIEINIPNPTKKMVPNLMATMNIRDYNSIDAVILPNHVILTNANRENFVFVVNDKQKVEEIIITTGRSYDNKTEVLEGLKKGMKVVDRGARKIVDGDRVEVRSL